MSLGCDVSKDLWSKILSWNSNVRPLGNMKFEGGGRTKVRVKENIVIRFRMA